MRIAFLGLPLAALLLHADGHTIPVAGLRRGLTIGARRLRRLVGSHRVVLNPHRNWEDFAHEVESAETDLLVSWFFTRRIPMSVVRACRLGGIGVHPSLLPRHRGPDPFFAAIDAGDKETGVTVHTIEKAYDTGAILAQRRMLIDPQWNAWKLARMLDRPSLSLLREVVQRMHAGESLMGKTQDESHATQAPLPTEETRLLRWDRPAEAIVRRIRALSPNPGALAFSGRTVITVLRAEVRPVHAVLRPGEAAILGGVAVIRAADEGVALLEAEVEGCRWGPSDIAQQIERSGSK